MAAPRDPAVNYGQPGSTIAPEKQAEIVELCRQGVSRNEIGRRTGVGNSAITGIIKRAGLSFDRTRIAAAAKARRADFAARRAHIIDRAYTRVETLQTRLEAETFKTLRKVQGGGEIEDELDFVPALDEKNLANTIASYMLTATRLEQLDAGDAGADVKSMLADLGRALGLVQ